jgi:hypothetical protein
VSTILRAAAAESAPLLAIDRPDAAGAPTVVRAAADQAEPRLASGGLYAALQSAAAAAPWVAAVTRASFPRWSTAPKYDAIDFAALSARIHAYEHGLASAGLRAAVSLASTAPPPGRFSTTTFCPSRGAMSPAISRAKASEAPPGG